jgi:hypothetical protein
MSFHFPIDFPDLEAISYCSFTLLMTYAHDDQTKMKYKYWRVLSSDITV